MNLLLVMSGLKKNLIRLMKIVYVYNFYFFTQLSFLYNYYNIYNVKLFVFIKS